MVERKVIHYIDESRLFDELVKHKAACRLAVKEGQITPRLNQYVGESILMLSKNIATQSCFRRYSYVEEMVMDGVENCIMYGITNFNPDKLSVRKGSQGNKVKIFAYFTQIITWAFIRRIQKEKKQQYIKEMNRRQHHLKEQLHDNRYVVDGAHDSDEFIQKFEESVAKKKQKRTQVGVEIFVDSDKESSK